MKHVSVVMFCLLALLLAGTPSAQTTYPTKPIRIVVGLPPGSLPDTIARLLAQNLAEALGKPVVVENVMGAAGNIAADRVAKAGALARAQPGGFTFASGGSGSGTHLAAELLKSVAGVDIRHIPYKGVSAAIPDLLAGRVTMMFSPIQSVLPLVREGRLRALAVTSLKRAPTLPDVPTIAESGYPGFEATLWSGLLAPAGTPATIIRTLHLETVKALEHPDLRAKFADLGMEVIANSPDEFAAAIKSEIPMWAKVIKESGIKAD